MKKQQYYLFGGNVFNKRCVVIASEFDGYYCKLDKVLTGDWPYELIQKTNSGLKMIATGDSMEEIMERAMLEVL